MSIGKIIGLVLGGLVVVLMVYVMSQGGSKTPVTSKFEEQVKPKVQEVKVEEKSEEEVVLDDLKKQAGVNLDQKVSQLYTLRCSSCHGKVGEGTKVGPSISGKSQDYILSKLDDYKNDRVVNSLMKGLLNNISDEEVKSLAEEISKFN
ncbi:MAG: c-type cytochrome [Arcobacteraceae bacterium]|nr:c-type cytochrome [Arcobacteraceae bacterium]MDY0328612.1 c-type cytochrome [Arcobacteraceae bacterium]